MFGLGIWELILILAIFLLLFGAKRLPEIGGSLGKGIREFKESIEEMNDGEGREEDPREISGGEEGKGTPRS
jgi:sec-independent protein translocase protein TatA